MLCVACAAPAPVLCARCTRSLRPVPPRRVGSVLAEAPFAHEGAGAALVRHLKYRRSLPAGRILAHAMVACLPVDTTCLVPVPRALVRMVRYGVDPALVLASLVGNEAGIPVVRGIAGPLWWPGRAGTGRELRGPVGFTVRAAVPSGAVVVDDVLTTGATVRSAMSACGPVIIGVVTATAAMGDTEGSPGGGR